MRIIYVGINVAKDKHDCCIMDSEADKLCPVLYIINGTNTSVIIIIKSNYNN